jgi:hypothetical protein
MKKKYAAWNGKVARKSSPTGASTKRMKKQEKCINEHVVGLRLTK